PSEHKETIGSFVTFAGIATLVSLGGIGLAALLYANGPSAALREFTAKVAGLYRLLLNKYYIDELYDAVVVRPLRAFSTFLWKVVDAFLIDLLIVNGVGFFVGGVGKIVRYFQTGDVQRYIVSMIAGSTVMLYLATHYASCSPDLAVRVEGKTVTVTATST